MGDYIVNRMLPGAIEILEEQYKQIGKRWTEIADVLHREGYYTELDRNKLADKIRKYKQRSLERDNRPPTPHKAQTEEEAVKNFQPELVINADGSRTKTKLVRLVEGTDLTAEQVLKIVGFDPLKWDLKASRFKAWNVFSKKADGSGHDISELYAVSVTAAPKKLVVDTSYFDKKAKRWRSNERFSEEIRHKCLKNAKNENVLEINIADLHLGKLCWRGDTGENYDTKIARDIFFNILDGILLRVKAPIKEIVFVWCNDFFNSDTINKTTTAGTLQDTDIRWQKLFNTGVDILCEAIIRLVTHFKVPLKTFYIESNHDTMACYYAIKVLEARFWNEPLVEIDTSALPRKIYRYGNVMIMYTHGHNESNAALAGCMVVEGRDHWSEIKYAEVHAAHLHTERVLEEINGVLVRRISSPTATDSWHKRKGYVGSVRKAQCFLINKETGIMDIYNFPIEA